MFGDGDGVRLLPSAFKSLQLPIIIALPARLALPAHTLPTCFVLSEGKEVGMEGAGLLSEKPANSLLQLKVMVRRGNKENKGK